MIIYTKAVSASIVAIFAECTVGMSERIYTPHLILTITSNKALGFFLK